MTLRTGIVRPRRVCGRGARLVSALSCLLLVPAFGPADAWADQEKATDKVKLLTLDLAVPDSPAFAILGLSPETVVRPGSPRDLATTILSGVDRRGNLQSGLAIDFAPRFLFAGNSLTFKQYSDPGAWGTRLSARTQLSFATAKGSGDGDKSLRTALGIRATLWDDGDPRMDTDLVKCLDTLPPPPPPVVAVTNQAAREAWEEAQTAARRPLVEGCHTAFKNRRWNASSLAVGFVPSWQSPSGESGDFTYAGAAAWASLAIGLSTAPAKGDERGRAFGQLIVQGRYRNKELVPSKTAEGTFFEQDSGGLGARLLLGTADRAVVVESEVVRLSPTGADSSTTFMLSGGGQIKLATGVWLAVAVGGSKGGTPDEQRGAFVLSTFKWGLSREPSVKFPTS